VAAAVLRVGSGPQPIAPAAGEINPFARGSFTEGSYHADSADLPFGIVARGSYIGGDSFRGTFITGWFGRRSHIELMVVGYPHNLGNSLGLEVRLRSGQVQSIPYADPDPGEMWKPWSVALPTDAVAFRIVAVDGSAVFLGWLAVSEPYRAGWRLTQISQASRSLLAFIVQGLLYVALALALIEFVSEQFALPSWLAPVGAVAATAMLGYVAFWLYFASPVMGRIYSWLILAWGAAMVTRSQISAPNRRRPIEWGWPFVLAAIIGVGAIALTCLFDRSSFSYLAANRFLANLPVDNQIPEIFAQRLWSGQSPKNFLGDWLSSDRPPLQTGWLLLTKPVLNGLGFDSDTSSGAGGVCFQLLWIPAAWALLRRMGAQPRQAAAVIAAMSFTGFFLLFTVFTWPKLGAAALLLASFVGWWGPPAKSAAAEISRFAFLGACAALAFLAHGGVAFSLIGLVPLALAAWLRRSQSRRAWLAALLAFAVVALPWLAYQKFYDPPGNRLLKWHLAGVIPPDGRGFGATLVESYRNIGWQRALANRHTNWAFQWVGHWGGLATFRRGDPVDENRWEQFYYTAYTFGWWLPGLIILPWVAWQERRRGDGIIGWTAAWWLAGWLVWIALMFLPNSAGIHQGTLLTQLLGFTLMAWCALKLHRIVFLTCATLEAAWFIYTWAPASAMLRGNVSPLAAWVSIVAALTLADIIITGAMEIRD